MYPVLLSMGPVGVRTAGVVAILAVWVAGQVAAKEFERRGQATELAWDFLGPALLAGLIGARLAYVLLLDPGSAAAPAWRRPLVKPERSSAVLPARLVGAFALIMAVLAPPAVQVK